MSDFPQATQLLYTLMGVEAEDQGLPLQILINLHRTALRAPLAGVAVLAEPYRDKLNRAVREVERILGERYPDLHMGRLFETFDLEDEPSFDASEEQLATTGEFIRILFDAAINSWEPYEPCALIYALSLPGTPLRLLQTLEIELRLSPQVAESVLQLAGLA